MKTKYIAILATLAATGFGMAQTAYTTPVGYTTQVMGANQFNAVGLTVQSPVVVAGDLDVVSGAVHTDSAVADFTTLLPTGRTFIFELLDGLAAGAVQEFTVRSGSTFTLPAGVGAAVGNKYQIRIAPTIEEVLKTDGSVVSRGPNAGATTSDIIWVPNGPGTYDRFYIRSTDSTVRNAANNAAAANFPLIFTDGLLLQKKNTGTPSLVVSGSVKVGGSNITIAPGFNLIGTVYPAGSTLQNIGLDDDISKGPNAGATSSDIIWVATTPGSYDRFYLRSSDSTWRNAATNAAAPASYALSSAVFVQRKAPGSVTLDLLPGFTL